MDMSATVTSELSDASALAGAGDWDKAVEAFEKILADRPDELNVRLAYGKAFHWRDPARAQAQFRRCLELEPDNRKVQLELARSLQQSGDLVEACGALDDLLTQRPKHLRALLLLAEIREEQGDIRAAVDTHLRAIAAAPNEAAVQSAYSRFLERQAESAAWRAAEFSPDSLEYATHLGSLLHAHRRPDEAAAVYERALEAYPTSKAAKKGLRRAKVRDEASVRPRRPAIWPNRNDLYVNFESVIRRFVLSELTPGAGILKRDTKVATLGSCFAEHLAGRLEVRGFDVFYRKIGEDSNNTYSNRKRMDWIASDPSGDEAESKEQERALYRRNFAACDLFIFSLGTSVGYFDQESGRHLNKSETQGTPSYFRSISLEENVENLRHIIERIRSLNPRVQIVLTVSPVALGGTFERKSAVLADCVSKSTLRLTVEEVLRDRPENVHYWPSFECVRWLGSNIRRNYPDPFGNEDGETRHVSIWLQDLVIKLFVEYFGDESMTDNWSTPADHVVNLRRNAVV